MNQCSEKGFCVTQQDCSACGETLVEVDVMTGNYPNETSWEIINLEDGAVIQRNDPILYKFTQCKKLFCLPAGSYTFVMNKSGKETLKENRQGYYALVADNQILKNDVLSSGTIDTKNFTL